MKMRITFVCLLFMFFNCSKGKTMEQYPTGGPHYFGRWKTYQIPYEPTEQITFEEAQKRDAYCVAYFNDTRQLVSFTKYLYGKKEFYASYTYSETGKLLKGIIVNSENDTTIQKFDNDGNLVTD